MLFVREVNGLRFEWQGGEYIDIFTRTKRKGSPQEALWITNNTMREPGWYYTDTNINVWDYDKGKPSMPRTQTAFDREVDKWIADNQ